MAPKKHTVYIFVTGGVLSGLGKGITAASLGALLKARGLKVSVQKCDPYLNVDAGTLNPAEHGECFVTADGAETDLDLGHYERFLDQELSQSSSLISGRVLRSIIEGERNGNYLGKTVQIIPHVTDKIQSEILAASEGSDVHIVEIGGTVGDYEGLSFIEAIRELGMRLGYKRALFVHVVYLPYLGASKEFKTKPAQLAARDLRSLGIIPDVLVVRSEKEAPKSIIPKLAKFCGVDESAVALLPNANSVYEVPLTLEKEGIAKYVVNRLGLKAKRVNLKAWQSVVKNAQTKFKKTVNIAIVAKYLDNEDTYMSVIEALKSASWQQKVNLKFSWIDAEAIKSPKNAQKLLNKYGGILVPGGFGSRGVEGKILAAQYALSNNVPYLGLCLGLQVAVIAFARGAGIIDANSLEFDTKTKNPVIITMDGQHQQIGTGGTMRLGNYQCDFLPKSQASKLYNAKSINERHRHRFEVNNDYREVLEDSGLVFSGLSPDGKLVEVIEYPKNDFFVASQFHPEFKSRPNNPHPLFVGFISQLAK